MRNHGFAPLVWAALALGMALGSPTARAEGSYELNAILSLTGSGSFLGQEEHQALLLAEGTINAAGGVHGRDVRFVFHDDQSSPQLAVQLATRVIASHPAAIFGASLVASCNAMAPLAANGPVMYCFSAGVHPPAGSYVFTAGISTRDQADALVRYFRLRGWKRIAIVTSTDATGQDADRGFDELLARPENGDIKVVERVHFNTSDVSVAAQVERIKGANAEALIVWTTGTPVATVLRGLVQAGLDLPIGTTAGNMTYAQMTSFAGFLPQQFFLPSSQWPVGDDARVALAASVVAKQREFRAAFEAAHLKPDEGSILAWDPVSIVIDALRALPEGVSASELRDYLMHLEGAAGVNGVYDFEATPQRGLSLDNTLITRWNAPAERWDVVAKPSGIPLGN